MRLTLIVAALISLAACNRVNFTPVEQTPFTKASAPEEPPLPLCTEGELTWATGGQMQVDCSEPCWDDSRLKCPADFDKELVCENNTIIETGRIRINDVGQPIGSCPVKPPTPQPEPEPPQPPQPPEPEPPKPPEPPATKPVKENFQAPPPGKADILVILDTTESMDLKLEKLAKRFKKLAKYLSDVDFQVAITNAGSTRSSFWIHGHQFGKIIEYQADSAHRKILTSKDPYVDYYFQLTVGRDVFTSGTERCEVQPYCMVPSPEPMASLVNAMRERDNANKGFFRKDAWLVPLIISDADENEDGRDIQYDASRVIEHFKSKLGSTMRGLMSFGVIVKPGDEKCYRSENSGLLSGGHYGNVLSDFVQRTGGMNMSICDGDYGPGLEQISRRIRETMSFIELTDDPLDGKVEVKITPKRDDITWTLEGRKLIFSQPLPANAKVEVSYTAKVKK